jgi:hypothetical protein
MFRCLKILVAVVIIDHATMHSRQTVLHCMQGSVAFSVHYPPQLHVRGMTSFHKLLTWRGLFGYMRGSWFQSNY